MRRKGVFIMALLCAVIYAAGFAGKARAAGPADNPACDSYTGAAYGMCLAAFAIGCDDPATANPGCATIEDKFSQVTGENPPWTLPPCPCGTTDYFLTVLDSGGGVQKCWDNVGVSLAVFSVYTEVFSFYPYQGVGNKQTCGFSSSLYALTDAEAQSCINQLKSIIDQYGLVCQK